MADFKLLQNQFNAEHTHNFYEFYVVLNGEFIEHSDNNVYHLKKGSVRIVKPQNVHYFEKQTDGVSLLRNIAIENELFETILKDSGFENHDVLFEPILVSERLLENYKEKTLLLLKSNTNEKQKQFIVKSIFENFLILRMTNSSHPENIPLWLSKAHDEIEKDDMFLEGIRTFVDLSTKSQEHFTREFKKHYTLTPSDYINDLKLKKATEMLISTDKKVIDIIYECGFDNVSYFNRLFKEKFSVTPTIFRETNKKLFNLG